MSVLPFIMKHFLLILVILTSYSFSFSQDIAGKWYGVAEVMGGKFPIGVQFQEENNVWTADLINPEKEALKMPFDSVTFSNGQVYLNQKRIGFIFAGTVRNDSIIGIAKQNGMDIPLVLTKNLPKKKELIRPQTPQPPFDYYTEDIVVFNSKDSIHLSGTLTLPDTTGKKVPIVILISGSGPQNRDSEILGHKPFAVIADHLAKQGIGSFRYDERGVGKSTGKYSGSDLHDFYSDVDAIVQVISNRKETKKLGLAGHSEGGIIAPWYASENKRTIDFTIILAGPGVPVKEMMHEQRRIQSKNMDVSDEEIAKAKELFIEIDKIVLSEDDPHNRKLKLQLAIEKTLEGNTELTNEERATYVQSVINQVGTPWYRSFVAIDPAGYLKKIKCPVLAIAGGKDSQVPMKENIQGISNSLNKKRLFRPDNTIKTYGNLNHLFQPCETGAVGEYSTIETTISRDVLFDISDFIKTI